MNDSHLCSATTTGEEEMKKHRRAGQNTRRILSAVMAVLLLLTTIDTNVLTAYAGSTTAETKKSAEEEETAVLQSMTVAEETSEDAQSAQVEQIEPTAETEGSDEEETAALQSMTVAEQTSEDVQSAQIKQLEAPAEPEAEYVEEQNVEASVPESSETDISPAGNTEGISDYETMEIPETVPDTAAGYEDAAADENVVLSETEDQAVLVTIVWDDENDAQERRPESVEVELKTAEDEEEICTAVLTDENADQDAAVWSYTFTELPEESADLLVGSGVDLNTLALTVEDVADYNCAVTGDAAEGYIVTYSSVADYLQDENGLYGQVVINPSNKLQNVGAVNGGGRLSAGGLRSYADENGKVTILLPGEGDIPSGSSKENYSVLTGEKTSSGDGIVQLVGISTNYTLTLKGWYDIDTGDYYDVSGVTGGLSVTFDLHEENVLYADYIPSSYDIGSSSDGNLADTVSTEDFVSMKLFDYNELFNLYSASVERIISTNNNGVTDWNENWHDSGDLHDIPNATEITHDNSNTFDDSEFTSRGNAINSSFLFRNTGDNSLLYVVNPEAWNGGEANVFQNAEEVWDITSPDYTANNLLNWLFNPDSEALGVTYVGDADYLFSYDEDTGVYSYDSAKNGVAYNQTDERFYVSTSAEAYNKMELFSPFTGVSTNTSNAKNDWWFGMNMTVDFKLQDATDSNTTKSRNLGQDGNDLFFTISADDDVLVFVDDELVLDMSGSHVQTKQGSAAANSELVASYPATGTIDFATGAYEYYIEENEDATRQSGYLDLDAGAHTITVYYMERSAQTANFSASFNIHDDHQMIDGTVVWDDANDQDGKRPESVNVNLMNGDTVESTQIVTAENDWNFQFVVDPSEGDYSVTQDAVADYETVLTASAEEGYTFTNSYTPQTAPVAGTITWKDSVNQDGKRPGYVTLQLFAKDGDGGILKTWDREVKAPVDPVYDADGNEIWTWEIPDLDVCYNGGQTVKYSAIYSGVDLTIYEQENPDDLNTIYAYEPETVSVSGSKTWQDDNNAAGTRPESITIRLHAGGEEIETREVTAADDWAWDFENLPVYQDGQEISYTLTEDAVSNYDTAYTFGADGSYNVTNTLHAGETSVTVRKVWEDANDQDGKRPESVTVKLLRDGETARDHDGIDAVLTLTAEDHWTGTFTNIDENDSTGTKITYTVEEVLDEEASDAYTVAYTGSTETGLTITNTHIPETMDVSGSKVWEDANDQDGMRPTSIYVHLLADGTTVESTAVTADENGKWDFAFDHLDKYAGGTEITYTVEEALGEEASDAYTAAYTGSAESGFTITNTHTPETIDIYGIKVWEDDDDRDGLRPNEITVSLLADGEEIDNLSLHAAINWWQSLLALFSADEAVTVDDNGNWTFGFTDLPVYADGREITYTLKEESVDGYKTAISGSAAEGFTITNTHQIETVSLTGEKIWDDANNQDGRRPEFITIDLLADGQPALGDNGNAVTETVSENDDGDWNWEFSDLPQYRDGGTEIKYTIEEEIVEDYDTGVVADTDTDFVVTNSYTPELYNGDGSFKVVLIWDDEANNDGIRPTEVNVKLTKNDTTVEGEELTLTEDETDAEGNWIGTFTGLSKYENGSEIKYSVKEDVKSGYTYRIERKTDDDGNTYVQLTNVHVSVKENIEVTKIWDDADNQDGKRPDSITVRLLTNGNLYKEKVLTADTEGVTVSDDGDVWQYTMQDIPVDKNGIEIEYTMLEVDVDNYGTPVIETIRGDEITDNGVTYRPYSFVVTNSHTPEQVSISGTKVWDDADNQDGKRPQYVTLSLYADEEWVQNLDVSSDDAAEDNENVWSWTFTDLDRYEAGHEIAYTIAEETVEDYETVITGDAAEGFTVTNSYTPETTEISGSKSWEDDNNADGTRPDSITVRLHANGNEKVYEQTVRADDGWSWTFADLPVYSDGQEITYTLTEDAVDEYDATYTFGDDGSLNVTNTLTPGETSLTVEKDWEDANNQDGIRPHAITVELFADGVSTGQILTLSQENHWTDTFHNLAEYEAGVRIPYTVQEVSSDGYESVISGDVNEGYVITNTHTPEKIELSGSKVWNDEDDQDGLRPDAITIHLTDGEKTVESHTVRAADDWAYTFADLDKYANGEEIAYAVEEAYTVDGYEVSIDDTTITNTHTPEVIAITGTKTWDDADNQDGIRPDRITVKLLADGEPVLDQAGEEITTTVRPDADGSWSYAFTGLDKCANGEEIQYSVVEDTPESYRASYTYSGYDMTNSYTPAKFNGDGTLDVIMRWDDDENQDGIRPTKTTVTLTINGAPAEDMTLVLNDNNVDEDGNWIGSFTDLDQYADGVEIVYSVEEGVMNGYTYTAQLKQDEETGRYYIELTNTHAALTEDITVTKVWDDVNDQDGIRPDRIVVNLYSNSSEVKSVALTEERAGLTVSHDGTEWTYTFRDMPVDMNGEPIVYTLDEADVDGYAYEVETLTGDPVEEDGVTYTPYDFTLTNTHVPETVDVNGEKIWDDNEDQDGLRPNAITIDLLADGDPALDENGEPISKNVTPHTDGSWIWTFTDLPKYQNGGEEIAYSFEEVEVEGYTTSYDGFQIINSHTPDTRTITGQKIWNDEDGPQYRPDSIELNLYANGLVVDTKTVTAADDWTWEFTDLPAYEDGRRITYITTETALDDYATTYEGFNLINTLDPGETSVTVMKDWEDDENQDGLRPDEITVELLANDEKTGETLTLSENAEGFWEGTFTELPEYQDGQRIVYSVAETAVDNYTSEIEGNAKKGFSIINTYEPETISISGSKIWEDADDQDGIRPESITLHLYADDEEIYTQDVMPISLNWISALSTSYVSGQLLSSEDAWSWSFEDLPKYRDGEEIVYTVTEDAIDGYTSVIEGDAADGFVITNTHEPEQIAITGTKTWDDADNQDGVRPDSITVNLLADGAKVDSQEVKADHEGAWEWSFDAVDQYANGEEISYTLTEDAVDGYTAAVSGDAGHGFSIINTHIPETTSVAGSKTWVDDNNAARLRPASITVRLYADDEETFVKNVTSADGWAWEFADLPVYENGQEITYTLTEDAVDDYSTQYHGYDVTNSLDPGETSVTVMKYWNDAANQDGVRPEEITVQLLQNGTVMDETLELSQKNQWMGVFNQLAEYDENGVRYQYDVQEVIENGYTGQITGDAIEGYVITNSQMIDITGSKTWEDAANQDGVRPDNITVNLLADGDQIDSAVVTEADDWSWGFAVPKYEDNEEIAYTVTEDPVEYYTTAYEENSYNITNVHETERIDHDGEITVTLVWDDQDDQYQYRPYSVTLTLMADGEVIEGATLVLTAANADENGTWVGTFTGVDLEKYSGGVAIAYSIMESGDELSEHYSYEMEFVTDDSGVVSIRLINTLTDDGETPEPEPEPKPKKMNIKTETTVSVASTDLVYNGSRQTSDIVVTAKDGTVLVEGVDYVLNGQTAKAAGTHKATITGIGRYYNTTTVNYKIAKADQKLQVKVKKTGTKKYTIKASKLNKDSRSFKLKVTKKGKMKVRYSTKNAKIKVNKDGKVTLKKGLKKGTYKIKVTTGSSKNYKANKTPKYITVKVK